MERSLDAAPRHTDEQLVTAWRAGDTRAGDRLVRRYIPAIRSYLDHRLGAFVDDALQDTLSACSASIARFEGSCSFKTWLFAIALNKVREARRSAQRWRRFEPIGREPSAEDDELSALLERSRRIATLHLGLKRIPENACDVLRLYYWEGLTGSALACELGVPENTARSRIRRGRQLLGSLWPVLERRDGRPCADTSVSDHVRPGCSTPASAARRDRIFR